MKHDFKNLLRRSTLWKKKQKRKMHEEYMKLNPFIQKLFAHENMLEKNNPSQLSDLAFKLYRRQHGNIVKIKDNLVNDSLKRRFQLFASEVQLGFSPLSAKDGLEILNISDYFLGITQEISNGLDVGTHFRISSSFSEKGRVLYNAVKIFRPKTILEVGTAYGMSARFLLSAAERYAQNSVLHTIEASEPQFALAKKHLSERFPHALYCHKGLSTDVIPRIIKECKSIDFVFHDGAHDGDIYVQDFINLMPALRSGSVIVFDDIRWFDKTLVSRDPKCYEGWREVIATPEVRCAVEINNDIGVALIVN